MATNKLPANAEIPQEAVDVKTTPTVAPSESVRPVQVMSSADSLVADLVKESKTLEEIESLTITEIRSPNPLALPDECLPLQRVKYRYKWLNKDKELGNKLNTQGWSLCNRTNAPYIKPSRFGSHGALEKAGMLLAFMPERMAQELEKIPAQRSADAIKKWTEDMPKSGRKSDKIGFYEPEAGAEDDDA
jgi:hypothetical protein